MKSKLTNPFEKYKEIRNAIDKQVATLEKIHHKQLMCRKGCDLCCTDYSIFPVEFYAIQKALQNEKKAADKIDTIPAESCAFLINHTCAIYNERPVICRTHGLPLLFANDDGEFELSACELNFTSFDFDEFSMDNTFHQDKYNSMLFMLNREFLNENPGLGLSEMDLLPLKNIAVVKPEDT